MFDVKNKVAVLGFVAEVLKNPDTFNRHLEIKECKDNGDSAAISVVVTGPVLEFMRKGGFLVKGTMEKA